MRLGVHEQPLYHRNLLKGLSPKCPATGFRIKNAGGKPPALGGPSIRGYRLLYSMRSDGFQMTPCGWGGWGDSTDKALNEWHLTSVRDIKKQVISKEKASKCRGRFPRLFHFGVNSNVFQPHPSITCGEIGTVGAGRRPIKSLFHRNLGGAGAASLGRLSLAATTPAWR